MGYTFVEKILAKAGCVPEAKVGQIVNAEVDWAMSHDNAIQVLTNFSKIGLEKVWNPEKIVIPLDHRVPANNIETAKGHKEVRELVRKQGIKYFYDIRAGICHQVMPEFGHVHPGDVIVGTDSHTTTYGAFGAFSTGIGATEMAGVWATGKLWLRVPESFKIVVKGKFHPAVSAKDLILHIIGDLKADGADYKSVEFTGPAIDSMSLSSRMVLCNMAMEAGAKNAYVAPNEEVYAYVKARSGRGFTPVFPDKDAKYERIIEYDVTNMKPKLACPHSVDNVCDVREKAGTKIDQVVLGSCTNGRMEDLEIAARILEGKKIADHVRMLVIPASTRIYEEAIEKGLISTFIKAGAVVLNSGCGPCLGAHQGILAPGEVALTTTNRNFEGRMGDKTSQIYLASPATAAYSALKGFIADPSEVIA
ncbi:MAG: 3-isopropylmalate dehydratase large subunit [Thermoplasmata archaeon]